MLGSDEGCDSMVDVSILGSDGEKWLSDLHSCDLGKWLAESVTHTCLQSIRPRTAKHLVDTQHVPWVHSHTQMEPFLTAVIH
jgi:hypothetical protein